MTTEIRTQRETYLDAIQECRDTFANVYHEPTTPYTELSWALSRVMGLDPKEHVARKVTCHFMSFSSYGD